MGTEVVPPAVTSCAMSPGYFLSQINFLARRPLRRFFRKELLVVQNFLTRTEPKSAFGVADLEVFRAIEQARARVHEGRHGSGKDSEKSCLQASAAKLGVTCNSGQPSFAQVKRNCLWTRLRLRGASNSSGQRPGFHFFFHRRFRTGDCWYYF